MTLRRKILTAAVNLALLPLDWRILSSATGNAIFVLLLAVICLHAEVTAIVSGAYRGVFAFMFRKKPAEVKP